MPNRVTLRPLVLSLLVFCTVPLLALLCRGHTPSRLATANLPVWEQQPPRALPPCRLFRLAPLPPGAVSLPAAPPWFQADENRLLAGVERPGQGDAGAAGVWLEEACAWGRTRPDLCAKQDRIAARLMTAQDETGLFGVPPAPVAPDAVPAPPMRLLPRDVRAQAACLRGLLAYYSATRRPAAIYAAMMAGNRAMTAPLPEEAMRLPLTRLYQQMRDPRYLAFARRQAGDGPTNALAECALYEATGQPGALQTARRQWDAGRTSPALTAELLLLTGHPRYAAALDRLPEARADTVLTRAAWTRAPLGAAVNTSRDSAAALNGLLFRQRTAQGSRTITVQAPRPTALTLRVFLPPGLPAQVCVDGVAQPPTPPGRYALLTRRWRAGDVVTVR